MTTSAPGSRPWTAAVAAGDCDLVDVLDFGEVLGGFKELFGEMFVGGELRWIGDGCGFGFDVGEDGVDRRDFAANLGFELGGDIVGLLQG